MYRGGALGEASAPFRRGLVRADDTAGAIATHVTGSRRNSAGTHPGPVVGAEESPTERPYAGGAAHAPSCGYVHTE
jgi:hypothetical protein